MKAVLPTLFAAAGLALAAAPAYSGDPAAGRKKAGVCQTCHGFDGIGRMPDVPHIGGESALYLARQLEAFRSGERRHAQMSIIASGLSDEDISDLVAWYSRIEITATEPDL